MPTWYRVSLTELTAFLSAKVKEEPYDCTELSTGRAAEEMSMVLILTIGV